MSSVESVEFVALWYDVEKSLTRDRVTERHQHLGM